MHNVKTQVNHTARIFSSKNMFTLLFNMKCVAHIFEGIFLWYIVMYNFTAKNRLAATVINGITTIMSKMHISLLFDWG